MTGEIPLRDAVIVSGCLASEEPGSSGFCALPGLSGNRTYLPEGEPKPIVEEDPGKGTSSWATQGRQSVQLSSERPVPLSRAGPQSNSRSCGKLHNFSPATVMP